MGRTVISGRQVINHRLLYSMDYNNSNVIRGAIINMDKLKDSGASGDQVALSIYIDMKEAIVGKRSPLTHHQRKAIRLNLVHDIPQNEVAELMGISQRVVSFHVTKGLKNISKFLMLGVTEDEVL